MGIMVYSLLWVMQDLYHQPYQHPRRDQSWGSDTYTSIKQLLTKAPPPTLQVPAAQVDCVKGFYNLFLPETENLKRFASRPL